MKKLTGFIVGLTIAINGWANIGGYCAAVDADGTHAFVGAGQVLLALDVSDPAAPTCAGTLYLPGLIEDVLVDGDTLYVACGDAGVHKVDVSNVLGMELSATYDSPGHAYGLARGGSSLYLADGVGGLQELDPTTLAMTGSYMTNAPARDVVADGSAIYLLDYYNGLIALDTSLNETGHQGSIDFGTRMVADSGLLYIAHGANEIAQVDMATLAVTNVAATIPTFGLASGMDIDAGKLYIADGFGGLSIHDAATEALLGSYSTVSRSRSTAVGNGAVFVAAGNGGVHIFNLPGFAPAGSLGCSNAVDVAVSGNLLLVADLFQGLELYDITSPDAPVHQGTYTPPSPAVVRSAGASGSLAYVSEGYTVRKLDISDPTNPVVAGSIDYPNFVHDIALAGTNLMVAQSITVDGPQALEDWNLLDVSDPLTPVSVTNFGALVRAVRMTLSDGTIYASADDGGTIVLSLPPITTDSDGDGLDDGLEQAIIDFDPHDVIATLDDVQPDDDFDGDGLSNLHEQLAGTSPVDPDSVFAISGLSGEATGHAVSWYSCAGHFYTVHKSTNLVEGFHVLKSDIAATEPINTHIDTEADDCAMYMITID